jgi:hypothetical protein
LFFRFILPSSSAFTQPLSFRTEQADAFVSPIPSSVIVGHLYHPSFRTEQADAFAFPIPSEESVGLRSEKSLFDFGHNTD